MDHRRTYVYDIETDAVIAKVDKSEREWRAYNVGNFDLAKDTETAVRLMYREYEAWCGYVWRSYGGRQATSVSWQLPEVVRVPVLVGRRIATAGEDL